jgi:uncharacterized protein (DUF1778 family)
MAKFTLSVRVSEKEHALLEAASELAGTRPSDFIRRKALDAAEIEILERRIIVIPSKDWEAFQAWADRPPQEIAGLKDLAGKGGDGAKSARLIPPGTARRRAGPARPAS